MSHGAYPKRPRLAGALHYANVLPKEVSKMVVLLESSASSNEYPLTYDKIMCYAEVDFFTTDDEQLFRNKIVGALKTQLPDIAPNDIKFVKVLSKRVTTPLVADGHNWDFKHVKNLCDQGKLYVRLVGNKHSREGDREGLPEEFKAIPVGPVEALRAIPEEVVVISAVGSEANTEEPVRQSVNDDKVYFVNKIYYIVLL